MFDVLLKNAKLIDGTSSPWVYADIGVVGDTIAFIGKSGSQQGKTTINAEGKFVCPGFIDAHTHLEIMPFLGDSLQDRLMQGITTIIGGNCGQGVAPVRPCDVPGWSLQLGLDCSTYPWESFGEFAKYTQETKPAINIMSMVPHGLLRYTVAGIENRILTDAELGTMCNILQQSMEEGAAGLSTGLIFPPAMFAPSNELIELCRVVAEFGGVFSVHLRNESYRLIESVREVLEIAQKSGVKLQISHHKVTGKANWGKIRASLMLIEQARQQGIDVMVDSYPYSFGANNFTSILPPYLADKNVNQLRTVLMDKTQWPDIIQQMTTDNSYENFWIQAESADNIILFNVPSYPELSSKSLQYVADKWGMSPFEAAFKLICADGHAISSAYMTMWEEDVETVFKQNFAMVGSDSFPVAPGCSSHPRHNRTFPRVLAYYCKEKGLVTLEEAVHKMTALPARRFGISKRGILALGQKADIVVFDYHKLKDSELLQSGIESVLVNGEIALLNGKFTEAYSGKFLLQQKK